MFREMRRSKQALSPEDIQAVLDRATAGVLAVSGDDGYPYAVPLSYVYSGGKIYFHCAKAGHKIDAIKRSEKVSFCVIDKDEIVPAEFTSYFRSVIVFGKARILESEAEIREAAKILALKYSADFADSIDNAISREIAALCMVEISPEHMTGKEAIELVKAKTHE